MTQRSSTIIFFGNECLATGVTTTAPTLKGLLSNGYKVAAVFVNQDSYKSRRSKKLEVEEVARAHDIPLLKPKSLDETVEQIKTWKADIGVLAAYGKIVSTKIIEIFPSGIVNIHPSLLPKGRGPTPIEQVILENHSETGVSIMKLMKAMDAGPVYAQQSVSLSGHETKQELATTLGNLGSKLLLEQLPVILAGKASPKPQDDSKASYNSLINKSYGLIDWHKPAPVIEREIRAYSLWPKSRATITKNEVIITEARVVSDDNLAPGQVSTLKGQLVVGTQSGSLEILKLQPINKAEMAASAFLAGYLNT